ncbi:MAG: polyphenol oxidase family protein [Oscillospiraceae bacterium]
MSFLAHEENGLLIKTSTVLSGVRHGFSTRTGGVSPAPWDSLNLGVGRGDDMDRVRENYHRFCAVLGTDEHRAVLSKQVHEDNVRHVTAEDCGKGLFRERDYTSVDAMITDTPDIPLVVFSADCGIILLYDPVRRAVGAAHAGWRGAAAGIVYKTVRRMQETFGTDPRALRDALGREAEPYITRRGQKWHVDLKGVNARWLEKAGVTQIDMCPDCTACRPDLYWSHRRMGQARGAQIAMICL